MSGSNRRRMTEEEAIQEMDRQAIEKANKVDKARCIFAINKHQAAVPPIKRLLISLGLWDKGIETEDMMPKSAKMLMHQQRIRTAADARVRELENIKDGRIPSRNNTIGLMTVPQMQDRLTKLSPALLSRGNLRAMCKGHVDGSMIALNRLIEYLTGAGSSTPLCDFGTWDQFDDFLARRVALRPGRVQALQLEMALDSCKLFSISYLRGKRGGMLALTMIATGVTKNVPWDQLGDAPMLTKDSVFSIEFNWSETQAKVVVSSDEPWVCMCSVIFGAPGIAAKRLPMLLDGGKASRSTASSSKLSLALQDGASPISKKARISESSDDNESDDAVEEEEEGGAGKFPEVAASLFEDVSVAGADGVSNNMEDTITEKKESVEIVAVAKQVNESAIKPPPPQPPKAAGKYKELKTPSEETDDAKSDTDSGGAKSSGDAK
jgi:hypothetical protein